MLADSRSRWRLVHALSLLAIGCLVGLQLLALWTYRLDYPIDDDWRYYESSFALPQSFSVQWLFAPAKDTVYATGKLSDWLFLRLVSHDFRQLAITSFVVCVLGWLVGSLRLAFVVGRDRPALLLAGLLVFALPLAGNPYWVAVSPLQWLEPAISYHQMLPVAGIVLLALLGVTHAARPGRASRRLPYAVVTAIFSLAYASGAAALGLFGGALLASSALGRNAGSASRDPLRGAGAVVLATAAIAVGLHVLLPYLAWNVNPVLEARSHELVSPLAREFWCFFFALFDRAVGSTAIGWLPRLRGAAVALVVAAPALGLPLLVARRRLAGDTRARASVIASLLIAVLGYAALVSYARAGFGGFYFLTREAGTTRAELYAHVRFFYWWIAASLPFAILGWGLLIEPVRSRRTAAAVAIALALLLLLPKDQHQESAGSYFHHWNYAALYRRDAREVLDLIQRDAARLRGEARFGMRRRQWLAMPEAVRNPRYRWYEAYEYKILRRLYRKAASLDARFAERHAPAPGSDGRDPRG